MTGCGRWSMMHELGPLALRQLELLITRSWTGQAGAAGLSERVARVPAGRDERDPQRFWLSVLAALRQTAPGLAAGAGGDGGAGPWTTGRAWWRVYKDAATRLLNG